MPPGPLHSSPLFYYSISLCKGTKPSCLVPNLILSSNFKNPIQDNCLVQLCCWVCVHAFSLQKEHGFALALWAFSFSVRPGVFLLCMTIQAFYQRNNKDINMCSKHRNDLSLKCKTLFLDNNLSSYTAKRTPWGAQVRRCSNKNIRASAPLHALFKAWEKNRGGAWSAHWPEAVSDWNLGERAQTALQGSPGLEKCWGEGLGNNIAEKNY